MDQNQNKLIQEKEMKDEEDILIKLVKKYKDPVFVDAFLEKARECIKEGNIKFAILALEGLLEINPKHVEGLRLLEECRKTEASSKKAVIEVLRHLKEVAGKAIVEIVEIGDLIQGISRFSLTPVPLTPLPERGPRVEAKEIAESKRLTGKDFTVTITPGPETGKLIVTITSEQFAVKSVQVMLKQETTFSAGEIVQETAFLKELVFSVPQGKSTLELFEQK